MALTPLQQYELKCELETIKMRERWEEEQSASRYIDRLKEEPFAAYELFCLWVEAGATDVGVDAEVCQAYLRDERGINVPIEEIRVWPIRFDWKDRFERARLKITNRINKALRYEESVIKQERIRRSVDFAASVDKKLKQLEKRLPEDIEKLEPKEAVAAYINLQKLNLTTHREQREEAGIAPPSINVNMNFDMMLGEIAERLNITPEITEGIKALALKEYVIDGEFTEEAVEANG